MLDKFEEQKKLDKQSLFREREVSNLSQLIYGELSTEDQYYGDEDTKVDTNRYDVHESKLLIYTRTEVKKLLKSKFVTGQSQDQIMKNLLNMSDSDEEEDAGKNKYKKGPPVDTKSKKGGAP